MNSLAENAQERISLYLSLFKKKPSFCRANLIVKV